MSLSQQLYEEMQQDFLYRCEQVESGEVSPLEAAVNFKQEMDYLAQLAEDRKSWLNEKVDSITVEAEGYGKEGYKGLIFKKQYRDTLSFKNIAAWKNLHDEQKKIEARAKLALTTVRNGMPNVDADTGEEIPLPEVKTSSFIVIEKLKR